MAFIFLHGTIKHTKSEPDAGFVFKSNVVLP